MSYEEEMIRQLESEPSQPPSLGIGSAVMAADNIEFLAEHDYMVVATVDDMPFVGWCHYRAFIRFMENQPKHGKKVSNVVWMSNEGCLNHLRLLYALDNDLYQYTEDEEFMELAQRYFGKQLPKLPYLKVTNYGK